MSLTGPHRTVTSTNQLCVVKSNDRDVSASCSKYLCKCVMDETTRSGIAYYVTYKNVAVYVVERLLYENVRSS